MAKEKTVDRVVTHDKLYLAVGGKLQHIPKGSKVTVTEAQASSARLGDKLGDPDGVAVVDVAAGGVAPGANADNEALQAEIAKLTKAGKSAAADNEALQAEIVRLTAASKK